VPIYIILKSCIQLIYEGKNRKRSLAFKIVGGLYENSNNFYPYPTWGIK
tara:strand:+ start:725 stop:871 length:147 start_codon:yes stop_codon:yes gene_type:complete